MRILLAALAMGALLNFAGWADNVFLSGEMWTAAARTAPAPFPGLAHEMPAAMALATTLLAIVASFGVGPLMPRLAPERAA